MFLNPNPHVVQQTLSLSIMLSVQYNNNEHNEFIYNELYTYNIHAIYIYINIYTIKYTCYIRYICIYTINFIESIEEK